jgi:hypothetical protein
MAIGCFDFGIGCLSSSRDRFVSSRENRRAARSSGPMIRID